MNKHTFAIVAYKESPFLEDCIISLKKQSMESKIILFTSTPSEFLSNVSKKYGIPLYVNNVRGGIGSDWSFAFNHCETEFVTLAHQDDIYLPDYSELCLKAAESDSNDSVIVFTGYKERYNEKTKAYGISFAVKRAILSGFEVSRKVRSFKFKRFILSLGSPIACPSVMYHKQIIGKFEFSDKFTCSLDWDAWVRLAEVEGSFVYLPKKLIIHRIYEDSQSFQKTINSERKKEEETIFSMFWPKPVAKLLAQIHYIATNANLRN